MINSVLASAVKRYNLLWELKQKYLFVIIHL
jgi:hypothetical protein